MCTDMTHYIPEVPEKPRKTAAAATAMALGDGQLQTGTTCTEGPSLSVSALR